MTPSWPSRLRELRAACLQSLEGLDDSECRQAIHPELSPPAWHVGHAFFVESFWLAETVGGDAALTTPWRSLFFPEQSPKPTRSGRLPDGAALRAWCQHVSEHCDRLWARHQDGGLHHALIENDFLPGFLVQHYAQHLETLRMVQQQHWLGASHTALAAGLRDPAPPPGPGIAVEACNARIGGEPPLAYDNELPPHAVNLPPFRIAHLPVSNAQWLGFMQAGGYAQDAWWDADGLRWLADSRIRHPQHWRPAQDGGWYAVEPEGPATLAPDAPVHGLCHHEARAYARWAGARLPHEYEWEAAARRGLLGSEGRVWEWCANPLHPYAGFRAFPYDGYSLPWFDGAHYVLRGGSRHTQAELRRASFRNFYPSAHRHIFAGLRLAW